MYYYCSSSCFSQKFSHDIIFCPAKHHETAEPPTAAAVSGIQNSIMHNKRLCELSAPAGGIRVHSWFLINGLVASLPARFHFVFWDGIDDYSRVSRAFHCKEKSSKHENRMGGACKRMAELYCNAYSIKLIL